MKKRILPVIQKRSIIMFIVLFFGIFTVLIVNFNPFKKSLLQNDTIQVPINTIKSTEFKGEITEAKGIIRTQVLRSEPYNNKYPLQYTKKFETIDKCIEYLGIEDLNLPDLKKEPVSLIVSCNKEGNVIQTLITTEFQMNNHNVQVWYFVFSDLVEMPQMVVRTELFANEIVSYNKENNSLMFACRNKEGSEYQMLKENVLNGIEIPIIISKSKSNNVCSAETYFSINKAMCFVNVSCQDKDPAPACKTMKELLQMFH